MKYIHDYSYETLVQQELYIHSDNGLNFINDNYEIFYRNLLLDKLQEHGFFGFLHTTEYNNFLNILKTSTLNSRNFNHNSNISFIDDANHDVLLHTDDNIKNYVRFYYFPQTPTNYAANYKNPVLLVFNRRIIFDKSATFLSMGGGNYSKISTKKAEEALTFKWDLIAERGPFSHSKIYRDSYSMNLITAYRNAEFLISNKISTKYIDYIIFKHENDYIHACNVPHNGIKFIYDNTLFSE